MTIEEFLAQEYGYKNKLKEEWKEYYLLWKSWYHGFNEDFHMYTIYNGRNEIPMHRHTLNMAKKCCEDWADLLFNEKCTINLSDTEENEELQKILTDLNFWEFANRAIEKAGSVGTGAIIFGLDNIIDNGTRLDVTNVKPSLTYIDIENIYPISWNNEKITECAFSNISVVNGQTIQNLSVHKKDEKGNYVIHNYMFELDCSYNIISQIKAPNIMEKFNTRSDIPWFVIISPNSNNNKQKNSPFGLSFFANSIDILKSIDIGFDSFMNEVSLSRKRIFVRDDLVDYGADGKGHPVFHASDIAVYTLPNGMDKNDMIQSENSTIRSESLEKYLKNMLAIFSSSVGFDTSFYSFQNNTAEKTATQVISENNEMYRRKKKHEILLESALYDLVSCICYALTAFGTYKLSNRGLTIKFDDSIIEDINAISNRAIIELKNGIISVVEYRQKVFGESEELAKEKYLEVLRENSLNTNNAEEPEDTFLTEEEKLQYKYGEIEDPNYGKGI